MPARLTRTDHIAQLVDSVYSRLAIKPKAQAGGCQPPGLER